MNNNIAGETVILRINNEDYFFQYLQDYKVEPYYKSQLNLAEKAIRRIFTKLGMPSVFAFEDWKERISQAKRTILFDYGYDPMITKYIKKKNKNCTVHLFSFNAMREDFAKEICSDPNIDHIWTFDRGDADQYGFLFNTSMYTMNLFENSIKNAPKKVAFVGGAKKREHTIFSIQKEIEKRGFETDFHVIRDPSDYVKYSEYLDLVRKSNCILDITNEGQLGLTLRFMESLFLSKKLITNNKEVLSQPFYNPRNIFVIGIDDFERFTEFMKYEYEPVSSEIVRYYDFNSWVERFAEVEK